MVMDRVKRAALAARVILFADDHAEKFTCSKCGREYISRGIHDPGNLCRDCEVEQIANIVGGPCNGEKVEK